MAKAHEYELWSKAKYRVGRSFKPHYCMYGGMPHVFYYDSVGRHVRICLTTEFNYESYKRSILYFMFVVLK